MFRDVIMLDDIKRFVLHEQQRLLTGAARPPPKKNSVTCLDAPSTARCSQKA